MLLPGFEDGRDHLHREVTAAQAASDRFAPGIFSRIAAFIVSSIGCAAISSARPSVDLHLDTALGL
jgi:hypothetical protein